MQNAETAGPCSPIFSHCSLFPDWFGICGKAVVISGKVNPLCCSRSWIMIPGLTDPDDVADAINKQRGICRASHTVVGNSSTVAPEMKQEMQK